MRPDLRLIEPRFKESLDRYVEHGISTGGFLEAVLCNNLSEAVGRADEKALENLPHIVSYIYNELPGGAWGSPERVQVWLLAKYEARNQSKE